MKIRRKFFGAFIAFTLVGLTCQIACQGQIASINSIAINGSTNNRIGVLFTEPVDAASATNPANYTVYSLSTGIVAVSSVVLQTNTQAVELTLGTSVGEFFGVTTTNILTLTSNLVNELCTGFISDYPSVDIGSPTPAGEVFTAQRDSFAMTAGGDGIGGTNDQFQFLRAPYQGDFDVRVNVTGLDSIADRSQAGLMARETIFGGSRMVATYFTSPGGSNEVEVAMRTTTNGVATDAGFQIGPRASASPLRWLRMTRVGNLFTTYHGTNGEDWVVSGATTQAFGATLLVGLMAASNTNGASTTASMEGLTVQGSRPGFNAVPTISNSVSGSTLTLKWNRTPRDFAMLSSTNLTDWSLHLETIFQTNSTQRYMQVPITGTSTYYKLRNVDHVVPNIQGLIVVGYGSTVYLSPGAGLTNGAGSNFCSVPINSTNVFRITDQPFNVPTPPSTRYAELATTDSTSGMDTVIQLRNSVGFPTFCSDDVGTEKRASMTTKVFSPAYGNFTVLVAPKSGTVPTSVMQLKITTKQ